jgi:hypothetical protein
VCVGVIALLGAMHACTSVVAPEDRLARQATSPHFTYYTSPGDSVDLAWQEAFFDWVTAALGVESPDPLEYHKYRDADHLRRVTGHGCCGFAESPPSRRFHTIWERDNHEMIHVLIANAWGRAPGLFNQGIVVAYHANPLPATFSPSEPYWSGRLIHFTTSLGTASRPATSRP